jgi:hypothetical protein
MSNKELARKTDIELVIDQRIIKKEAAKKLGATEQQFKRIVHRLAGRRWTTGFKEARKTKQWANRH